MEDAHHCDRKSHEIALDIRGPLQEIGRRYRANVKIVEIPPGPPVQSPLVAEVYGLDHLGSIKMAKEIREIFTETPGVVYVDDSVEFSARRLIVRVARAKAGTLGEYQKAISDAVATVLGGEDATYLHGARVKYAMPVRMEFSIVDKATRDSVLSIKLRSREAGLIPMRQVVELFPTTRQYSRDHKDLLPVVYVTGDMAGPQDSPLYGMFEIYDRLLHEPLRAGGYRSAPDPAAGQPRKCYGVKWDGE